MRRAILFTILSLFIFSINGWAQNEYRIEIGTSTGGKIQLYHENGNEITETEIEAGYASVVKDEVITVVASPSDANHQLSSITVQGGNNIKYDTSDRNKAWFTVTGTSKVVVTPVFTGNDIKVAFSTADTSNGSFTVRYNGKTLSSGATVPYGAEIEIEGKPTDESYAVEKVLVNGQPTGTPVNNKITYKVTGAVTAIVVYFENRTAQIIYLKPASGGDTPVVVKGTKANFETAEVILNQNVTKTVQVPYNTSITIQPKNYTKAKIYTLIVNGQPCALDADGYYSFIAKEDHKITLTYASKSGISPTLANETTSYTGQPQKYNNYSTNPAGLSHIQVNYKTADTEYTTTPPTEIGVYTVQLSRDTDEYMTFSGTKTALFTIEPAPLKITSLPNVREEQGNYTITGGSACFKNKTVQCDLSVAETTGALVKVVFTPKKSCYQPAFCWVPLANETHQLSFYTVKLNPVDGAVPVLYNGDKEIQHGEKIAEGTPLVLTAPMIPQGFTVEKIINKISDTQNEYLLLDNTNRKELIAEKAYDLYVVLTKATPLPQWNLKNPPTNRSATYSGALRAYSQALLPSTFVQGTPAPTSANIKNIRYKDETGNFVLPINAGVYELWALLPAEKGFDSISVKTTYTISAINPTLPEKPQPATTQVPYGMHLKQVPIIGGQPNVAGTFQWLDGEQLVENGKTYTIQFIPDDSRNYHTITAATATLSINNEQLIYFGSTNGSIAVKNKNTGIALASGDRIQQGDQLIISATPNAGYYLHKLGVCKNYGMESSISSGVVYTVEGDSPLIIQADFRSNSTSSPVTNPLATAVVPSNNTYQVYVPTVAGAITSPAGYHTVKEGESFTLQLTSDPGYAPPTVKANGQTINPNIQQEYVYTNIDRDVLFTVDVPGLSLYKVVLPDPTPYGQVTLEELNNLRSGTEGFVYGSKIRLTALAAEGTSFIRWGDGSTENPREYTIQGDLFIKAEFRGVPTSISPIDTDNVIYSKGKNIFLKVTQASLVKVTDILGRTMHAKNIEGETCLPLSRPGIYVISIYRDSKLVKLQKIHIK